MPRVRCHDHADGDRPFHSGPNSILTPVRVLTVGNMYPPHHFGGYELVWRSAVDHLRSRGHEVEVLTTDTDTGATEPDPPGVHRELRWRVKDAQFAEIGRRAKVDLARQNHRVLESH